MNPRRRAPFVSVYKVLQEERHVAHLVITALPQLLRDLRRHILRPFFGGVEGNDPDGVFVLAIEQVGDHSFQICTVDVGFALNLAVAAEVVHDEIYILIVAVWDDRRRPSRAWHTQTPPNTTDNRD